jgi:hypothetical protein
MASVPRGYWGIWKPPPVLMESSETVISVMERYMMVALRPH